MSSSRSSDIDIVLEVEDLQVVNQIDAICDRFESAWRSGARPSIQAFLVETLGQWTSQLFSELVQIDMEYRLRAGEAPSVDEYVSLYPQYSEALSHLKVRGPFAETIVLHGAAPRRIGKYDLRRPVGQGGFGVVWKAWDTQLERWVAVKIPREKIEGLDHERAFLREARAAAELNHPHIVPVIEAGRENGIAYIVSGFVEGITLREWRQTRPLSHHEIARLCLSLASALEHAHKKGVVHRDLKPGNILIDGEGEPHVADFGLASRKLQDTTIEPSGNLAGTPAYMAPEQIGGPVRPDRRCDVYSLGVTLYELLTGSVPFKGSQAAVLHQVLHIEPTPPGHFRRDVPADLETICLKAMSKNRRQRYDTAAELADDLRRYLNGQPIRARRVTRFERAWRWMRRNPAVTAATSVALLATMAALSFAVQPRGPVAPGKRQVVLNTEPAGARVVFYRLDERTGEPDPAQRTEARKRSSPAVEVELPPGDYFVVAALDDGRFHEVYRHVPAWDEQIAMGTVSRFSMRSKSHPGRIQLPRVNIPHESVTNGMARIDGAARFLMGVEGSTIVPQHARSVSTYYIDTTEVPVSSAWRGSDGVILGFDSTYRASDGEALHAPYLLAVQVAEQLGKRLPTETEYEFAATNRGASIHPWGNDEPTDEQIQSDRVGLVGTPTFDVLPTVPPVVGLSSNVAEWTTTYACLYPPMAHIPAIPLSEAREKRVVRGPYRPRDAQDKARTRVDYDVRARRFVRERERNPELGLRCVRSAKPHLTADDFKPAE